MSDNQPNPPPVSTDPLGLKPGEIFWNNYRVVNIIGKGGVSTVYKAENLKTKEFVAIKLLHAQKAKDEELVRRFIRECQTTTKLTHPHAIAICEWGIDNQERPFMVIEYLAGETLSRRIQKSGGLNFNKAVDIMEQICAAIQEAHSLGIIHRDLKPDNIMLITHQGMDDWVKVCDFGIAKLEETGEEGSVAQAPLTRTGAILGTPMYMSPEQLRGRKADARSDIYALGCIMYEMLTGKPPFASKNTAEIVVGHLNLTPEMPHKVRMDLNIPERLSEPVMRALSKNPWERQTTVQELVTSLRKAVDNKPGVKNFKEAPPPKTISVNTPTPYGMVVDPVKRVCFKCQAVASGSAVKFCLKCGQDNTGKWLPYHEMDKDGGPGVANIFADSNNRRLLLWVLLGIILCWSGYTYLNKPIELTGRFQCNFDHQLFAASKLSPALAKKLRCTHIDMILAQDDQGVHGMLRTPFGEDNIDGKITQTSPMIVSYDFTSSIHKSDGRLDLEMTGTYDKISRSYDWSLKAFFQGHALKPVSDTVKVTVVHDPD